MKNSHIMYRMVKPSKQQSDYGPREWYTESWSMAQLSVAEGETCELLNDTGEGYRVVANLPVQDDDTGYLHYKAMVSTLGGTQKIEYPQGSSYYEMKVDYRAPYGNIYGSVMLFLTIAVFVWGGLGVCLRMMMDDNQMKDAILDAEIVEEASS